ncbi:MAG: hypothetical protein HY795_18095 [Desulfovibrio sp.]|nr:hypothetical protein [Desulfovibrio sp.]MBI4959866.1 hypothetical protein [Desulfovibrio sp.]
MAACCSVFFCLVLCIPLTAQVLNLAPQGKLAEATNSPFPDFAWNFDVFKAMGKSMASGWLDKNFPLRGLLIRWYNYSSATLFGSISGNSPVVVGKEGWLYLAKDRTIDVLEEHRAVKPLTEPQLKHLASIYEERKAWLAERGIKYLVVIAPNKNTLYPEYLPDEFKQVGQSSRMEQVMAFLEAKTDLNVLDLRLVLQEAKKTAQVFYATDSHWNARGAFPSYQAVIERLGRDFPKLKPMSADEFYPQDYTFLGGDLSYMVGLEELVTEHKVFMLPKKPLSARGVSTGIFKPGYTQPAQASLRGDVPGLPKAVFFHDSYFWDILGFLGEHFSRSVYVWMRPGLGGKQGLFDKELIESEKPDVVVEQVAERFFLPQVVKAPVAGDAQ